MFFILASFPRASDVRSLRGLVLGRLSFLEVLPGLNVVDPSREYYSATKKHTADLLVGK